MKMSKMTKLYRLNLETAKGLNIAHFNPTCKAILKTMYRIEKSADSTEFKGMTGDEILAKAVELGLWSTRQDPSKYHTTWAYYVKKLKTEAGVIETGASYKLSTEEFLDDEEELLDEPSDDLEEESEEEISDYDRALTKAEDDFQAKLEDAA
jgi:hypothetical protein